MMVIDVDHDDDDVADDDDAVDDDDGGADDESRMPALMGHASSLQSGMAAVSNPPVVHRCSEMSEHLCTSARGS